MLSVHFITSSPLLNPPFKLGLWTTLLSAHQAVATTIPGIHTEGHWVNYKIRETTSTTTIHKAQRECKPMQNGWFENQMEKLLVLFGKQFKSLSFSGTLGIWNGFHCALKTCNWLISAKMCIFWSQSCAGNAVLFGQLAWIFNIKKTVTKDWHHTKILINAHKLVLLVLSNTFCCKSCDARQMKTDKKYDRGNCQFRFLVAGLMTWYHLKYRCNKFCLTKWWHNYPESRGQMHP